MDFINLCSDIKVNITNKMLEQFNNYHKILVEKNEVMNLTAITKYEEVFIKHFFDSLTISEFVKDNDTLCDVGSGAGFPSIPLAITNQSIKVTIVDALNKRINFLNDLTKSLELNNVEALHYRAEDYVKIKRDSFDVVTARAVARLNVLAELCLPLVKVGGIFIALKGSSGNEELDEAKNAINILGGKLVKTINLNLPNESGERQIIIIKKVKASSLKYPRNFNMIKNKPL